MQDWSLGLSPYNFYISQVITMGIQQNVDTDKDGSEKAQARFVECLILEVLTMPEPAFAPSKLHAPI